MSFALFSLVWPYHILSRCSRLGTWHFLLSLAGSIYLLAISLCPCLCVVCVCVFLPSCNKITLFILKFILFILSSYSLHILFILPSFTNHRALGIRQLQCPPRINLRESESQPINVLQTSPDIRGLAVQRSSSALLWPPPEQRRDLTEKRLLKKRLRVLKKRLLKKRLLKKRLYT